MKPFKKTFSIGFGILISLLLNGIAFPQNAIDKTSTKLVKEYTTRPEFSSPLVDYIPESDNVSSPRDFLGYVAGAPKKLTHAKDIHRYFYELAAKSDRISVFETGKSNEGRPRILAVIADKEVLKNIKTYKDAMKALADPRKTPRGRADKLLSSAKPFYLLTGGLHSPETGSPEMLMELAYRLVVSETDMYRSIRKNLITLIIPVLEVDGREKMVDWYYRYTVDRTDFSDGFPRTPPYWGKYTLHDNNREGLQISQPLTKQMSDVFFEYLPVVSLDLHESVPLLYISTGTGPYNPNIDPLTVTEFQLFANYEVSQLTKYGMPGVWTWGFYTGWYPGYLLWITANHNAVGRFYETFGNAGATTYEREIRGRYAKKDISTRQWYRPVPPPKKVLWSFRNNINYMQSGVISGLYFASQNGRMLLENFYKKGINSIDAGKDKAPYAWIIPSDQARPDMLNHLLKQLGKHRIEVHRLDKEYAYAGTDYPAGSYVVRLDQPYGPFAKGLLENQSFPADADYSPYDDVAWTLGLQYGIETVEIDSASILLHKMTGIFADPVQMPEISVKNGGCLIVPHTGSPSLITLRFLLKDYSISALKAKWVNNTDTIAAGSWIVQSKNKSLAEKLITYASRLKIPVIIAQDAPDTPLYDLDIPKIGVYHNWIFTQNTGWFRFTIEQYGIDYTLINDDVIRQGGLNGKFDMIIIPELGGRFSAKDIIHGRDDKYAPIPYKKTDKFPSHGAIDHTDDITRGMGFAGAANLESFIDNGGLLVTLGCGTLVPVELGLVSKLDVDDSATRGLFNPGSFVKTKILQENNPITFGYEKNTHVFAKNRVVYSIDYRDRKSVVMQFGTSDAVKDRDENAKIIKKEKPVCLSGVVKNQANLVQRPAIVSVPRKKGRVVMFTFNPAHRYMNHHDLGFLFNAILFWNDLK